MTYLYGHDSPRMSQVHGHVLAHIIHIQRVLPTTWWTIASSTGIGQWITMSGAQWLLL